MLLLTACSRTEPVPVVVTEIRTIKQYPPDIWLRSCADYLPARIDIHSTGDLARAIPPLISAIEQCSEDKARLRAWAAGR